MQNSGNNIAVNAYDQGDYDRAASIWNPLAEGGDYAAQYNLGLLWEQGLGSTPLNTAEASHWFLLSAKQGYVPAMVHLAKIQKESGYEDAAISWFNLAARWGDAGAIQKMQNWGKPVPSADLLATRQYQEALSKQRTAENWVDAAYALGKAVGGGGAVESMSSHSKSTYTSSSSKNVIQSTKNEKNAPLTIIVALDINA